MCVCGGGGPVRTMVSHQEDVDTAVKLHLFKSVHQLSNDPVDHPQRAVELKHKEDGCALVCCSCIKLPC